MVLTTGAFSGDLLLLRLVLRLVLRLRLLTRLGLRLALLLRLDMGDLDRDLGMEESLGAGGDWLLDKEEEQPRGTSR